MKETMINLDGSNHHDGTILGAVISISCALVAILPSLFELGKKFDAAFIPLLHVLQGAAAFVAIIVGVFTIIDKCSNWIKQRNKK